VDSAAGRNLALTLGERFQDIKFVIRDRGSNFTQSFDAVFQPPAPGSCGLPFRLPG
jgi:hypothetical protein